MWEIPPLDELKSAVATPSCPIGKRMRAAYFLRQLYDNHHHQQDNQTEDSIPSTVIQTLGEGLKDPRHGSLLRHEFAYVMGQLRDANCCLVLGQVLLDDADCVMVRHECAEALGAIGLQAPEKTLRLLEEARRSFSHVPEISETCEIALAHLYWQQGRRDKKKDDEDAPPPACACMTSPYSSVDPAPPHASHVHLSVAELGTLLCRPQSSLFERYQAMFSLRNRGGTAAVEELGRALTTDATSALFRHEVAYVLGQMQHPAAVDSLAHALRQVTEHAMVRHEAAEALGAMEGGRWDECHALLQQFLHDDNAVVAESCAVALDAAEYFGRAETENEKDDEDTKQVTDEAAKPGTFGGHKAQSNGLRQSTKEVLRNHFNIASNGF